MPILCPSHDACQCFTWGRAEGVYIWPPNQNSGCIREDAFMFGTFTFGEDMRSNLLWTLCIICVMANRYFHLFCVSFLSSGKHFFFEVSLYSMGFLVFLSKVCSSSRQLGLCPYLFVFSSLSQKAAFPLPHWLFFDMKSLYLCVHSPFANLLEWSDREGKTGRKGHPQGTGSFFSHKDRPLRTA